MGQPRIELWLKQTNTEANRARSKELVATEEVGTQVRRQIGAIPPRTDQAVQPALGHARIGDPLQHRKRSTSLTHYSLI